MRAITLLFGLALVCAVVDVRAQNAPAAPAPLTAEQAEQIRTLVQRTQAEQARLRTALTAAQEKLASYYMSYELDEERVTDLHKEISELQHSLLASYHSMHKELRTLVTPERFQILSRRIENAIKTSPPAKQTTPP